MTFGIMPNFKKKIIFFLFHVQNTSMEPVHFALVNKENSSTYAELNEVLVDERHTLVTAVIYK